MDAVILAGALNTGRLREVSSAQYEAEIMIGDRPMLDYVVRAIKDVSGVKKIIVVGPESGVSDELKTQVSLIVKPGNSLLESLNNGLTALETEEPVLVLTSDIPLITKEALEDFIAQCAKRKGDIYYSFVSKEINDQKYPGVQRTYVKLRDGVFTGGNVLLLSSRVVKSHREKINKAAALRKKPIQLCAMLGFKHLLYFLMGKLTIKAVEERATKILNLNAVGIISPYPEVGIDVDKPSDLQLACKVLVK